MFFCELYYESSTFAFCDQFVACNCGFKLWFARHQLFARPPPSFCPSLELEHVENDHGAHTTYTTIQLRVYYRTVPDMQHPTPTYGSMALPEYRSSHDTTVRTYTPIGMIEPPQNKRTDDKTWPTSDRPHDIELLRQYHRITRIICQRFQSNTEGGGRRTAKRQTYIEWRKLRFAS